MEMDGMEKRRHQRVKLPYTMKFRSNAPGSKETWDAVTPINMSESGICFLTTEKFPEETEMQLLISTPLENEKLLYDCKVLRCTACKARSIFFETVVTIEHMSDRARTIYAKLLYAFSNEIAKKQLGL
ncbi:MAG: PilZ domain-containing protein [Candidatus Omnitrophica bacterium]|nr:PilZ domain-containing protein [Candidatus Omnitrophota bacterium]